MLYLWAKGQGERRLLYGTPLEQRPQGQAAPANATADTHFTPGDRGLVFVTALFDDAYGLGYLTLDGPGVVERVAITGTAHSGAGELTGLRHVTDNRYRLEYNIDGASWLYEGTFDEPERHVRLGTVMCGQGALAQGVLAGTYYDKGSDRYALSFSTASSPTQIYTVETVEGADRRRAVAHTHERVLGIPASWLSRGEEASFVSHDGLRISARLYLPAQELGFAGPRPLI